MGRTCGTYGGRERCAQGFGGVRGRDHSGDQDVDGRIILRWILRKGLWGLDGVVSGYGQVAGACEYCTERSGSIKCRNFLMSCKTS